MLPPEWRLPGRSSHDSSSAHYETSLNAFYIESPREDFVFVALSRYSRRLNAVGAYAADNCLTVPNWRFQDLLLPGVQCSLVQFRSLLQEFRSLLQGIISSPLPGMTLRRQAHQSESTGDRDIFGDESLECGRSRERNETPSRMYACM